MLNPFVARWTTPAGVGHFAVVEREFPTAEAAIAAIDRTFADNVVEAYVQILAPRGQKSPVVALRRRDKALVDKR